MATKTKATIQQQLTVQRRAAMGTRPVRRLRAQDLVPGVVYGRSTKPMAVVVSQRELTKLLHAKAGEHALVTLRVEGGDGAKDTPWEKPVLVKAVQHDPVDAHILHVDFQAIMLTQRLRVKIPVLLKGEPAGVKQEGGILEHFLREIAVECLPTEIPEHVEFDVSTLKIGDTIHVRDLTAPKQAKITSDPEGVLASVHLPKMEKVEEEAAVTEPEVIREKKETAEEVPGEPGKTEAAARPGAGEPAPAGAKGGPGGRAGEPKKEPKDKEAK